VTKEHFIAAWCWFCERTTFQTELRDGRTVCATCEHLNGEEDH
jgi:uncharacterized Zn finger protein (UPF0148 family)